MEEALRPEPSDSVTVTNLAHFVHEAALREIIGPAIDFRLLKETAGLDHLAFLYHDHAGRKDSVQRLRTHAGINREIALLERSLLLASRRDDLYKTLNELYFSR